MVWARWVRLGETVRKVIGMAVMVGIILTGNAPAPMEQFADRAGLRYKLIARNWPGIQARIRPKKRLGDNDEIGKERLV